MPHLLLIIVHKFAAFTKGTVCYLIVWLLGILGGESQAMCPSLSLHETLTSFSLVSMVTLTHMMWQSCMWYTHFMHAIKFNKLVLACLYLICGCFMSWSYSWGRSKDRNILPMSFVKQVLCSYAPWVYWICLYQCSVEAIYTLSFIVCYFMHTFCSLIIKIYFGAEKWTSSWRESWTPAVPCGVTTSMGPGSGNWCV